jgi:hypothetical protein
MARQHMTTDAAHAIHQTKVLAIPSYESPPNQYQGVIDANAHTDAFCASESVLGLDANGPERPCE